MELLKKIFDKNTDHGRALRTALQGTFAIVTFLAGFLTIPGIGGYLATNNITTLATFGVWLGIVTYAQNAIERLLKWLSED